MTAPKNSLIMGLSTCDAQRGEKVGIRVVGPGKEPQVTLIAGQKIKGGDILRRGRNGKAYPFKMPKLPIKEAK